MNRRTFITNTSLTVAGTVAATALAAMPVAAEIVKDSTTAPPRYRPLTRIGMGGVAAGNGFHINPDREMELALDAAWNAGTRFFDSSPWYGFGLSERRMGYYLRNKERESFTFSTKVGRILSADNDFKRDQDIWKGKLNFNYKYDYSADGVRRSIEDSLQRLGLPYLDIVFIHDLSPDNGDMKENWVSYFDQAAKGAMPALTRMREEGIIKGWGLGVNTLEPAIKALQVADPDVILSATQYSLIKHADALKRLFPICEQKGASVVVGAPLNAGFLAGVDRYDYAGTFPAGVLEKRAKLQAIAANHHVKLLSAALQFCAAPKVVSGVIPGSHTAAQATENAAAFKDKIPAGFWQELKSTGLIEAGTPTPGV